MTRHQNAQSGMALVTVLFVMAIMFLVAGTLLLQSRTERVVTANEQDHVVALGHAEAGIAWAQRRVFDSGSVTDLLLGPDDANADDDNLIGLRDLSLTSTAQFTNAIALSGSMPLSFAMANA